MWGSDVKGDERCIGVFDSGIGGLTVVAELRRRLPHEDIVYFGDTARVPYGIKSPHAVTLFARQDCDFLLRFDPKMIVVACNTVSAVALPDLEAHLDVPLIGVVRPGATSAARLSGGRPIAVIATEATVNSDAYRRAIQACVPDVTVHQRACPLFVGAVEEGRGPDDAVVRALAEDYLGSLRPLRPAVVVLGCTHYPLLKAAVARVLGPDVALVDSAEQTAEAVREALETRGVLSRRKQAGSLACYVSDNPQRFREIGQRFLGHPLLNVTCVSPEEFLAGELQPAHSD